MQDQEKGPKVFNKEYCVHLLDRVARLEKYQDIVHEGYARLLAKYNTAQKEIAHYRDCVREYANFTNWQIEEPGSSRYTKCFERDVEYVESRQEFIGGKLARECENSVHQLKGKGE